MELTGTGYAKDGQDDQRPIGTWWKTYICCQRSLWPKATTYKKLQELEILITLIMILQDMKLSEIVLKLAAIDIC